MKADQVQVQVQVQVRARARARARHQCSQPLNEPFGFRTTCPAALHCTRSGASAECLM